MQIQKKPSVGELIEHTEMGDTATVEAKLQELPQSERQVISAILEKYLNVETGISKVAIFHAACDFLEAETGLDDTVDTVDQVLTHAEQIREDIKVIENAITSPDKVVVRNDRSDDLGGATAVLQGTAVAKPYGYKGRNSIMVVGGSKGSIPLRPLLRGVRSAGQVIDGSNARWAINQNAVQARFEQWCHDVNKETPLEPELDSMIKTRKIMRIFNTYIDIITETESTFLQNNELLQKMIDSNRGIIIAELASQLAKNVRGYEDNKSADGWGAARTAIVKKYMIALRGLGLTTEELCNLIADETPDDEVATSLLYEAA